MESCKRLLAFLPDEISPVDRPDPTDKEASKDELHNTNDDLSHVHLWLTENSRENSTPTREDNVQNEHNDTHASIHFADIHLVVFCC